VKHVWFVLAWVNFGFGVIGAFLPIIPTTPFLILSAYLFSKSSPRFHAWILNLPVAGDGIRDWQKNRVIRTRAKVLCVTMISLSVFMIHLNKSIPMVIKYSVVATLIGVGGFVVTRKSHA
jgi:uncharacterized membrane protein YbaN (DUF454 family)